MVINATEGRSQERNTPFLVPRRMSPLPMSVPAMKAKGMVALEAGAAKFVGDGKGRVIAPTKSGEEVEARELAFHAFEEHAPA